MSCAWLCAALCSAAAEGALTAGVCIVREAGRVVGTHVGVDEWAATDSPEVDEIDRASGAPASATLISDDSADGVFSSAPSGVLASNESTEELEPSASASMFASAACSSAAALGCCSEYSWLIGACKPAIIARMALASESACEPGCSGLEWPGASLERSAGHVPIGSEEGPEQHHLLSAAPPCADASAAELLPLPSPAPEATRAPAAWAAECAVALSPGKGPNAHSAAAGAEADKAAGAEMPSSAKTSRCARVASTG
mmetsp:Transcript_53541/g.123051  ORF Transcript_53541/g.123051 Transcript_53541/m.123051 type:complete len:257 (+) Transcript_53541:529-1299(+)